MDGSEPVGHGVDAPLLADKGTSMQGVPTEFFVFWDSALLPVIPNLVDDEFL